MIGTFDRHGTPAGALVIAVHGAVANRKTWLPLVSRLPDGIELWCADLPGHGDRRAEPFALASALAAIDALVVEAGSRRVIVAGDSLGGYLALAAAARRNSRIAGVVAGGCSWSMTGWRGTLARASDLPPRAIEAIVGSARVEAWASALLPRVTDAPTARAIVDGGLRARARSESLRELAGIDVVALVRAIDTPIAIVNGIFDWPTRAQEGEMLRAARDATLVLGRSGHGVGFLAPQTFADAIADVVARASR